MTTMSAPNRSSGRSYAGFGFVDYRGNPNSCVRSAVLSRLQSSTSTKLSTSGEISRHVVSRVFSALYAGSSRINSSHLSRADSVYVNVLIAFRLREQSRNSDNISLSKLNCPLFLWIGFSRHYCCYVQKSYNIHRNNCMASYAAASLQSFIVAADPGVNNP
jgi:ABC-type transporter Mla MlaB component